MAGAWEGPGAYVRVGTALEDAPGAPRGRRGGPTGGAGRQKASTGGEGWSPGAFRSSRAARGPCAGPGPGAEAFMDAGERDASRRAAVGAVRDARLPPLEWRTPGARLLMRMGWRRGQSLGGAGALPRPVRKPRARRGRQGLGFEVAPEFRAPFSARLGASGLELARAGPAWGGMEDEYGTEAGEFDTEIAADTEAAVLGNHGSAGGGGRREAPGRLELEAPGDLTGFIIARLTQTGSSTRPPPLPEVPKDFVALHRFVLPGPFQSDAADGEPDPVAPPGDPTVTEAVEALARFVARVGPGFEDLARERGSAQGARFRFLRGGVGAAYYKYRLVLERQRLTAPRAGGTQAARGSGPARGPGTRTAAARGEALGEQPLPGLPERGQQGISLSGIEGGDRAALVKSLGSMFTKGASAEAAPQVQAGLRPGGRRTLETTASGGLPPDELPARPTSQNWLADLEKAAFRAEEEWRPAPLLCKRLGVPDPFRGKKAGPKAESRFKTDHLSLPETARKSGGDAVGARPVPPQQQPKTAGAAEEEAGQFLDSLAEEMDVPGPPAALAYAGPGQLDIFKAIFEDNDTEGGAEPHAEVKAGEGGEVPSGRVPGGAPAGCDSGPRPTPRLNPELEVLFGAHAEKDASPEREHPSAGGSNKGPQLERIMGALSRYREVREERKRRRASSRHHGRDHNGDDGSAGGSEEGRSSRHHHHRRKRHSSRVERSPERKSSRRRRRLREEH